MNIGSAPVQHDEPEITCPFCKKNIMGEHFREINRYGKVVEINQTVKVDPQVRGYFYELTDYYTQRVMQEQLDKLVFKSIQNHRCE